MTDASDLSDPPAPPDGCGDRARRFRELALPHLDAAYNLARWLSGSAADAEDVVQDAYLRAFRFFDGFHGVDAGAARAWLLAIVRHAWFDEWRRRGAAPDAAGYDEATVVDALPGWSAAAAATPEALAARRDEVRQVHAALARLPVEYREAIVLRELEEMSYRDIARVAGVPVGTVMSRLARGRRLLAQALQRGGAPRAGAGDAALRLEERDDEL